MKRLLGLSILALLLLLPAASMAWDLNKDFYNTTGQVANDIEIYLDGTPAVTDHYDGDPGASFPGFQTYYPIWNGAYRTVLRWSGYSVQPGARVHVGYTADGATIIGWCWTHDGVPIGPVQQVDILPMLDGQSIQLSNTLTYSLWPAWPYTPPVYHVISIEVYYFPAVLPLPSLNLASLPSWTPLRDVVLVPPGSPFYLQPGIVSTVNDPGPLEGAGAVVWVVSISADPGDANPSTDFIQFNLAPTPVESSTWGHLKTLYR